MKQDKDYRKHSMEYFAAYIRDVYPNVESIAIKVHGKSGSFKESTVDEEYRYLPSDKNLFLIPCPNRDCNGIGFNLTSEVWNMVHDGEKRRSGRKECREAESDKIGSRDCLSEIEYVILIEYR